MKNLGFSSKKLGISRPNFEILGFLLTEFQILGISSEIPNISKKLSNPKF